jgi:hypothetical protein
MIFPLFYSSGAHPRLMDRSMSRGLAREIVQELNLPRYRK